MKLALILDNASFHRSKEVKELAASPEVDIKLIFNATGRPDLATVGKYYLNYTSGYWVLGNLGTVLCLVKLAGTQHSSLRQSLS